MSAPSFRRAGLYQIEEHSRYPPMDWAEQIIVARDAHIARFRTGPAGNHGEMLLHGKVLVHSGQLGSHFKKLRPKLPLMGRPRRAG